MGRKGKDPKRGDGAGSWTFDGVRDARARVGWIAGDIHGVHCHSAKGSKPCRKLLLGEKTLCEGCLKGWKTEWLGYVPLYRGDGKPHVVIIHEHLEEYVSSLPLHAYVKWFREQGPGEPVQIERIVPGRTWHSTLPEKNRSVSITRWLCRIWRMPDLLEPLMQEFGEIDNGLSPHDEVTAEKCGAAIDRINAEATAKTSSVLKTWMRATTPEPAPLEDVIPHVLNGKAKKK